MRARVLSSLSAFVFATSACGAPEVPAVTPPAATQASVKPGAVGKPHVLVISIDGMRPVELESAAVAIPTLRELAAHGAVAQGGVETVRPSLTYPAHATMMTGVSPARHGIVANSPPDPKGTNQDGWYWYASDIKAPTLWDLARTRGLTTGAVYWPVTVGANMTALVPQVWRAKIPEDEKLLLALTTPALAADLRAAGWRLPGEHNSDYERASISEYVIRRDAPNLMLSYLTDLDTTQHDYGPGTKEAATTLATIDGYVAKLVRGARERNPDTTVVIVSDHGFVPITREFRPNVALAQNGFMELDEAGKITAWVASSWRWNGAGAIVLRHPEDAATKARVRALFEELAKDPENGIVRLVDPSERPELVPYKEVAFVLDMKFGTIVSKKTTGLRVAYSTDRGAHGYDPKLPEMRASLILEGPRVRPGVRIEHVRMEDVAPTVAALLGLEMQNVEGRVLTEALAP